MMEVIQDLRAPPRRGWSGASGEIADIDLLHRISLELIGEQDRVELYGKIVDAAVAITGSQFGTMQLLMPMDDPSGHGGELQLLSSRGLPPEAIGFWQWVSPQAHSSCTQALKFGRRSVIPDFEAWDDIAGTEDLEAFRRTGIRSAQTTPLLSRSGELLGMISTHWNQPHQPSERDLRLLDILARQAADLLERTITEEASRQRERELERTCAALRESEDLQRMLAGELSHRVKNMLATVQAIAVQTLRHSAAPADFVDSFGGRIQSMSKVHSQLSTNEWKGTELAEIVRDQMSLGPVDEDQVSATGPQVYLDAVLVPKVAMMLHELGTNSLKYGALSKSAGRVEIAWAVTPAGLEMIWLERGGPKVEAPFRRGFGTRLIEASAQGAGGRATMSALIEGVRWDILLPLSGNRAEGASPSRTMPANDHGLSPSFEKSATMNLEGKRILVVEDEPLLAMDITSQLEAAGAAVVGPAGNAFAALSMVEQYRFHAALLDANLAGEQVDEIAALLAQHRIPFVFVSGYDRASLPAGFEDAELLSKPFSVRQLVGMATKLVAQSD